MGQSAVRLVDDLYAGILRTEAIADRGAMIRGAIVHKDDFQIPVCLPDDGVEAFFKVFLHLVDWDDDGNQGAIHHDEPKTEEKQKRLRMNGMEKI
jgi:hypothetical protein